MPAKLLLLKEDIFDIEGVGGRGGLRDESVEVQLMNAEECDVR